MRASPPYHALAEAAAAGDRPARASPAWTHAETTTEGHG